MPPVRAKYFVRWIDSLGLCQAGMSGPVELSAVEITAWAQGMGLRLRPWEFVTLKKASQAFVNRYHSKERKPPFGSFDDLSSDAVIEQRLERYLDKLAKPRKRQESSE